MPSSTWLRFGPKQSLAGLPFTYSLCDPSDASAMITLFASFSVTFLRAIQYSFWSCFHGGLKNGFSHFSMPVTKVPSATAPHSSTLQQKRVKGFKLIFGT